jgi:exopolysaccharide production protein ExoZ
MDDRMRDISFANDPTADQRATSASLDVRGIQYLRGLAALGVLAFHVSETYQLGLRVGAAGVDVFFVISGFIMWLTTAGRDTKPSAFMRRRFSRIVPLYWIVTLLTAIAISLKPAFFFGHDASWPNFVGSLLFAPQVKNDALRPVVVQGWTLTYEMFFYVIFAASLILPQRFRLAATVSLLVLAVLAHAFAPHGYAAILTDPILLEFAAGVLIADNWVRGDVMPSPIAVAMVVVAVAWLSAENAWLFHEPRIIGAGVPAAMLVAGVVAYEKRHGLPYFRVLHFLGDASYSIYLWHVLTAVVTSAVALRIGVPAQLLPFVIIAGSLVGAVIAYLLVEKPINEFMIVRHVSKRTAG